MVSRMRAATMAPGGIRDHAGEDKYRLSQELLQVIGESSCYYSDIASRIQGCKKERSPSNDRDLLDFSEELKVLRLQPGKTLIALLVEQGREFFNHIGALEIEVMLLARVLIKVIQLPNSFAWTWVDGYRLGKSARAAAFNQLPRPLSDRKHASG